MRKVHAQPFSCQMCHRRWTTVQIGVAGQFDGNEGTLASLDVVETQQEEPDEFNQRLVGRSISIMHFWNKLEAENDEDLAKSAND